jgi:hypothetical protein
MNKTKKVAWHKHLKKDKKQKEKMQQEQRVGTATVPARR